MVGGICAITYLPIFHFLGLAVSLTSWSEKESYPLPRMSTAMLYNCAATSSGLLHTGVAVLIMANLQFLEISWCACKHTLRSP